MTSDLALAADDNFVIHAGWLQRMTVGMVSSDDGGVVLVDSGLPCDTFNLACRSRLSESTAPSGIRRVLTHFGTRPFSWWVGPADSPPALGELLQSEGLAPAESELAMAADLSTLPETEAPLRIERVASRRQLHDFASVNAANWTPPDEQVLAFYGLVADAALRPDCPLRFYVGYLGDTPVATAELTVSGSVVGLYNIATLAGHRRRGFGTAMTLRPLLEARNEGATTAILQAAPDGVGIYRRAGFRAFGEITEYKPAAK